VNAARESHIGQIQRAHYQHSTYDGREDRRASPLAISHEQHKHQATRNRQHHMKGNKHQPKDGNITHSQQPESDDDVKCDDGRDGRPKGLGNAPSV
jgi:hypothetical protein